MALLLSSAQVRALLGTITVAGSSKTITAATNATPIVITATAHGYSTGDTLLIAAVGGNTNANGISTITVTGVNAFSLNGSAGNSAYTSGGTATRITSGLRPGDLGDLETTLARMNYSPRGEDSKRSSESTIQTIFGV